MEQKKKLKCELYNDNFQNYKSYNIPAKAQLVITDIPYNIGNNAMEATHRGMWAGIMQMARANWQGSHFSALIIISTSQNTFISVQGS